MSEIAKAKVADQIESAKRDVDGRPLWMLEKDGALIISEEFISQGSMSAPKLRA
jgi:hypothetical protein